MIDFSVEFRRTTGDFSGLTLGVASFFWISAALTRYLYPPEARARRSAWRSRADGAMGDPRSGSGGRSGIA